MHQAAMAVPCGKSCPLGGCREINAESRRRQRELEPRQLLKRQRVQLHAYQGTKEESG